MNTQPIPSPHPAPPPANQDLSNQELIERFAVTEDERKIGRLRCPHCGRFLAGLGPCSQFGYDPRTGEWVHA